MPDRLLFSALAWVMLAGAALAQPQAPQVTVSANLIGASLVRAPVPGQSNPSLPTTGLGGSTLGVSASVDLSLSRRIAVGIEISTSSQASDHQEATKYLHMARLRDTILTGYARLRLRPASAVRLEPVGGASVVFSDVQIATSYLQFVPTQQYGPFGDYERWPYGHRCLAVSAGIDVPIGHGRFVFAPTFRLHYILRDSDTSDQIGLGRWAIRPGFGVRASF